MNVTIYHNPKCSKSRKTLELLLSNGVEPTIVEYLVDPPDVETLKAILGKLNIKARQLLRDKEARFVELALANSERPIVIIGERAVIGRPPENIYQLLEGV
jgi:arsenate reductase